MRFQDKVVIVTGGNGGIGLAICKRLGDEGARVVVAGRDPQKLEDAAAQTVRESGAPDAFGQVCDVGDEAQVEACVKAAFDRFGRLDAIVNNAGVMHFGPLETLTREDWYKTLDVDLLGAFYFIKQAFLTMKNGGSVVNVSSVHQVETTANVTSYATSKAAVGGLTRAASIEGKAKNIRVNALLPGAIDTPMLWSNPNIKSGAETIDKADVGKPEDIAAMVAFLCSDDAAFITGASFNVDGGRLAKL